MNHASTPKSADRKKLTSEQQTRGAGIHARANTELRAAGFVCLRQFTAAGSAGTGESFEIWAKAGKTVIVQFYAQAGGHPATEAFDDWFAHKADADSVAECLARGDDPYTPENKLGRAPAQS